jgi:hypothetical protein
MKKFIFLGSIALLILSCGSDDDDNTVDNSNPTSQNVILPVKMSVDGEVRKINYDGTKILNITDPNNSGNKVVFSYNGDLISNIKFYEENILQTAMEYTYNSNNLLVGATDREYSSTGVVEYIVTNTYTHVSSNQISVKRQASGGSNMSSIMNTVYNYSNGNMVSASGNGSGTNTETATYTYTDKNYPFKNVKGFDKLVYTNDQGDGMSYLFSNIKNNISSYKVTSSWSTGTSYTAYKFTTTFSSSGYPIYESRQPTDINGVPSSSQPEIHTYEYNH